MGLYRKRPVVIEARQWDGSASQAGLLIEWALDHDVAVRYREPNETDDHLPTLYVDTLEGTMQLKPHSWLVKGVGKADGRADFYPVDAEVFDATYEPVPEPSDENR